MSASFPINLTENESDDDTINLPGTTSDVVATTEQGSVAHQSSSSSEEEEETRLRRFRNRPTIKIQDRIDRALEQQMFLISKQGDEECHANLKCTFVVLGSTGNVYDVIIQRVPHCTCPDHANGNLCKHILFVLLKVMRVPSDSLLIYQEAWVG